MAVVRICMCSCGHLGIQETEASPLCRVCGTDDVDWLNMDADDLEMDLKHALELLPALNVEKKDGEDEDECEKASSMD